MMDTAELYQAVCIGFGGGVKALECDGRNEMYGGNSKRYGLWVACLLDKNG